MPKTVSILICTRNRADYLRKMLSALPKGLPPDAKHIEIVLVDNGSADDTGKVMADFAASRPNVKIIF